MDKRFLEDCLTKGMSLEAIGELAGKHPSTVGYWLKKHGLTASGAERFSPRGGIDCQPLSRAVEEGLTVREMAERFDRNASTIRYWLRRHGLQATGGRLRRDRREATRHRPRAAKLECRRHGVTEFILEGRGYYRCKKCRSRGVAQRRRTIKRKLVEEAGGACIICGYRRCFAALEFHHLDPAEKSFNLSLRGITKSIDLIRQEAAKCVLLCATCHAEVEAGFTELPERYRNVAARECSRI